MRIDDHAIDAITDDTPASHRADQRRQARTETEISHQRATLFQTGKKEKIGIAINLFEIFAKTYMLNARPSQVRLDQVTRISLNVADKFQCTFHT